MIKHIWTLPQSSRLAWLQSILNHSPQPEITICHDGLTSGLDQSVIVATVAVNYATTSTKEALANLIAHLQSELSDLERRFP